MIEKQREKEFLFELEQICHNYYIILDNDDGIQLHDVDHNNIDATTECIENFIDGLRDETLEDVI